jgi:hypothetical protein
LQHFLYLFAVIAVRLLANYVVDLAEFELGLFKRLLQQSQSFLFGAFELVDVVGDGGLGLYFLSSLRELYRGYGLFDGFVVEGAGDYESRDGISHQ